MQKDFDEQTALRDIVTTLVMKGVPSIYKIVKLSYKPENTAK